MQLNFIKVVSAILLVASISVFTGLSSFAAPVEKAEKACCDGCDKEEGQGSAPCSTPVCPAFLCLSFDRVEIFVPQISSLITTDSYSFIAQPVIKQFVKSILHPPSIV